MVMGSFSERYGYFKVSDALIVEKITPEIINAIYNCYKMYIYPRRFDGTYETVQKEVCNRFLNQVLLDSSYDYISPFLLKGEYEWYKYLDFLEFVIGILILNNSDVAKIISDEVNKDFERLNYGYRIINNLVTPITSKEEVHSIEETISSAKGNIKEHLNSALKHLADKENPDYRNSIKESISAVGALCREMTGENDLGKALFVLEKKQGKLHPQLKAAFDNLYKYVNEKQSGIRHELMDESGTYVPTYHEAKYMLVICSAFINYLNGKFGSDK